MCWESVSLDSHVTVQAGERKEDGLGNIGRRGEEKNGGGGRIYGEQEEGIR